MSPKSFRHNNFFVCCSLTSKLGAYCCICERIVKYNRTLSQFSFLTKRRVISSKHDFQQNSSFLLKRRFQELVWLFSKKQICDKPRLNFSIRSQCNINLIIFKSFSTKKKIGWSKTFQSNPNVIKKFSSQQFFCLLTLTSKLRASCCICELIVKYNRTLSQYSFLTKRRVISSKHDFDQNTSFLIKRRSQ